MPLIDNEYAPPGVYTQETFDAGVTQLNAAARIPVLIGEGVESFTQSNVALPRGSSASTDNHVVGENISDQVDGVSRTFTLGFGPIVSGDGSGTVTSDPTKIQVIANGVPVTVLSLDGVSRTFKTQQIIPAGTNVVVSYFFKQKDTWVLNEDLTSQIPTFATLSVAPLTLSLSIPGALGNLVSLELTLAATGSGVSDALAVTGAGTDAISIELRGTDDTIRTSADLAALIQAGIPTLDGGYFTFTGTPTAAPLAAQAAVLFANGSGQSTNTVFKTKNVPIVDGSNGGVVTTDPSKVQAKVSGVPVTVTAVDGANGLVTLAQGVPQSATLELTYYTNTYQNTSDLLPASNVASIVKVGYGPNRADFVQGTDYVLNGNSISWGAAANTVAGQSTPGFTPFDATAITTTLVDEKVFLRPVSGAVSGRNSTFTLADTPVDGSGLGRPTDNPTLVSVYVGATPVAALASGPVKVARLFGASAQVLLYNPPALGQKVFASYYRSTLNDHQFTLAVKTAGIPGHGSYTITDELGQVAPVVTAGAATVADANFTNTGLVFPNNFPDLAAAIGGVDETVTLTFQDDGLTKIVTPAVQASFTFVDSGSVARITFRATNPGTVGDAVTISMVGGPTGAADASAITVNGTAISIATVKADNTTVRTWQEIVDLFTSYPPTATGAGQILCTGVPGAVLTAQSQSLAATHLAGGVDAVTSPVANRFLVTTSRTAAQAKADGHGLTGGATTPTTANTGVNTVGAVGYLGQTYIDATTALKFTVVDPSQALSFGFTQLPSPSYAFKPGDTVTFTVNSEAGHVTGSTPTVAIPGLQTKVVSTYGTNPTDTAVISTFNRAGKSPSVGETYYVTFTTAKTAADFAVKVFSSANAAYAVYGQPSVQNRLSLAIKLFVQNGGQQFACIQVPKQADLGLASDQAFIDGIQSLASGLPGSGRRVNVIVPLSTSATVQQFLAQYLTKQATPLNKGEAIGFIGFDRFASANTIAATAQSIINQRVVANDALSLGISLQGPTELAAVEYAVTGEFAAAAMAGLNLSAGIDVATTLTGKKLVGFTRRLITFDEPTKNQLAVAGVTVLEDADGALNVRHYKTTDPSNVLTSEPHVTTTADFINQSFRVSLKQFEGRKMTSDLPNSAMAVLLGKLSGWASNDTSAIISAYGQLTVTPDATDPTTLNIEVPVKAMFSALYFNVNLSVSLS